MNTGPSGGFARSRKSAAIGAVLALLATGVPLGAAAGAAPLPGGELVVNGGLDQGTSGWRTNDEATQRLTAVAAGHTGAAAQVTAVKAGTVVLNDVENTVPAAQGKKYAVSAWVKTTTPGHRGQLRVREVSGSQVTTHATTFSAVDTGWQRVTLDVATAMPEAHLDLNVLAWDLPAGSGLVVDDISMTAEAGTAPAPAVQPVAPGVPAPQTTAPRVPAPAGHCAASERGIPSCGVMVGSAVGGNTDPTAFEKSIGNTLQVRRTFWRGDNTASAVRTAGQDIAAGRLPWLSFKLPYSWSEMAAGKGDAWANDLSSRLGALKGPVWIAFHHEPEGDGNIQDWVAMQRHLAPIVHKNTKNVAFTMIVTGWHEFYGDPQYRMDKIWPGDGLVDLVGFDIYNEYGVVKRGKKNTEMLDLASTYYPQIAAFTKAHKTAWGIAETGYTDEAAGADPLWLDRTYSQMANFGGVALTYFNTSLNSNGNSWEITTSRKRDAFKNVLKRAVSG